MKNKSYRIGLAAGAQLRIKSNLKIFLRFKSANPELFRVFRVFRILRVFRHNIGSFQAKHLEFFKEIQTCTAHQRTYRCHEDKNGPKLSSIFQIVIGIYLYDWILVYFETKTFKQTAKVNTVFLRKILMSWKFYCYTLDAIQMCNNNCANECECACCIPYLYHVVDADGNMQE